jgi:hypothetical protein
MPEGQRIVGVSRISLDDLSEDEVVVPVEDAADEA